MKDHVRWAHDQNHLDTTYVTEAREIAHHPEILGMSIIYPSKLEELFELQKRNQHWAFFTPPDNFQLFRKRFFSYRLFPSIHWEEKEEGEEENASEEEDPNLNLISAIMKIQAPETKAAKLFAKDKDTMLNLLESIQWINRLIKHIHARKMQYQKG